MRPEDKSRARNMQEYLLHIHAWPSCVNCEFWDAEQDICDRFKDRPPARVIVVGCEEWTEQIPF